MIALWEETLGSRAGACSLDVFLWRCNGAGLPACQHAEVWERLHMVDRVVVNVARQAQG